MGRVARVGRQGGSPRRAPKVIPQGGSPRWVVKAGRQGGSLGWVAGVGIPLVGGLPTLRPKTPRIMPGQS